MRIKFQVFTTEGTKVTEEALQTRQQETFIIGKQSISVKPAPAARSGKITVLQ
jgi:hypothetical protein